MAEGAVNCSPTKMMCGLNVNMHHVLTSSGRSFSEIIEKSTRGIFSNEIMMETKFSLLYGFVNDLYERIFS